MSEARELTFTVPAGSPGEYIAQINSATGCHFFTCSGPLLFSRHEGRDYQHVQQGSAYKNVPPFNFIYLRNPDPANAVNVVFKYWDGESDYTENTRQVLIGAGSASVPVIYMGSDVFATPIPASLNAADPTAVVTVDEAKAAALLAHADVSALSGASGTIPAPPAGCKGIIILNDPTSAGVARLGNSAGAGAGAGYKLFPGNTATLLVTGSTGFYADGGAVSLSFSWLV